MLRGVNGSRGDWPITTHIWVEDIDADHLEQVRTMAAVFAADGMVHLILEVLAYAADEADATGSGRAAVTLHGDGSVSVADFGRGTDTRADHDGEMVKKPVASTKDVRFFDDPSAAVLPDGKPRRGMSIVAACSEWLIHTNRRRSGAWIQRYEYGVPVTALRSIPSNGSTGTKVHFLPDPEIVDLGPISRSHIERLASILSTSLSIEVLNER